MRLSVKKEEKTPIYYPIRENNNEEEIVLYNLNDFIYDDENSKISIYEDINKDRTNKIYDWQSKDEIAKIIAIEPLTTEQRELIEEQLRDTDLYSALNKYRIEYGLYDISKIKEEIKEIKTEILKLNEVCCAMSEAVYND